LDQNTITIHFLQSGDLTLYPACFITPDKPVWVQGYRRAASLPVNMRQGLPFGPLRPPSRWSCAQCPCDTVEQMFTHTIFLHILKPTQTMHLRRVSRLLMSIWHHSHDQSL